MCQLGDTAKITHLIHCSTFTFEKYFSLFGIFQLFKSHLVTLNHDFTLLFLFSQQEQQKPTIIIMCPLLLHFIESTAKQQDLFFLVLAFDILFIFYNQIDRSILGNKTMQNMIRATKVQPRNMQSSPPCWFLLYFPLHSSTPCALYKMLIFVL